MIDPVTVQLQAYAGEIFEKLGFKVIPVNDFPDEPDSLIRKNPKEDRVAGHY